MLVPLLGKEGFRAPVLPRRSGIFAEKAGVAAVHLRHSHQGGHQVTQTIVIGQNDILLAVSSLTIGYLLCILFITPLGIHFDSNLQQ